MPNLIIASTSRTGNSVTVSGTSSANTLVRIVNGDAILGSTTSHPTSGAWSITFTLPDSPLASVHAVGAGKDETVLIPIPAGNAPPLDHD